MVDKANKGVVFQDSRGQAVQVMRPVKGSDYRTTYTGTAAVTAEITEEVVDITCTTEAYIKIGGTDSVTASSSDHDRHIPANIPVSIRLNNADKYVSVVQVSSGGTAYINGWT